MKSARKNRRLARDWTDLYTQSMQLGWAAPQVVALRLGQMMTAGPAPSARDRREFRTMGTEKWTAFNASGVNMMARSVALQQEYFSRWASLMWQLALGGAWANPAGAMQALWQQGVNQALQNPVSIAAAGLRPISQRALSNSKRLTRRRPG